MMSRGHSVTEDCASPVVVVVVVVGNKHVGQFVSQMPFSAIATVRCHLAHMFCFVINSWLAQ